MTAAVAMTLAACGSERPIFYYTLDAPAVTPAPQKLDVVLVVANFQAQLVYRDTRIVYRLGPNEVGLYQQHRWAEAPAELVREMVLQSLRKSGRYMSVQAMSTNARGDYILRGRVERFEEVDNPSLTSRVSLHFSLWDPKKRETVWSQDYQNDVPVSEKEVSAVAASMNQNLQQGIQQVTAALDQYLTANPKPPASGN